MLGRGGRERRRDASRGQAETIGVVLILAMTLIGATVALAFGATGLDAARINAQEGGVEHAMTQLDSRSAMVALGDSDTQRVRLSASGQGGYRVDPDAGWINVTHSDYDGNGNDTTLYNESLGVLVYERDDKLVAYQGGGVWQTEGDNSTMISPPEFHYQSATLTLPVIRVRGDSSVGGAGVTAMITRESRPTRVYPNQSASYPETGANYTNPVREGNVTVTVKSDFYQGWANYFRTRTTGEVDVDDANETVSVKLISFGTVGAFEMPSDGQSIELRGLGEHSINDFNITLIDDNDDNADFSNLKWSLYAEKGNQEFEIHLVDTSGGQCNQPARVTIYYAESGTDYESWTNGNDFLYECEDDVGDDFNGDGDTEDVRLVVNMTATTTMNYESVGGGGNSDIMYFSTGGGNIVDPAVFNEHGTITWESDTTQFQAGSGTTTIDNVTNHYLTFMGPNVELTVDDGQGQGSTVNEDESSGTLDVAGSGGRFITFLHITENRVVIELG
jgi:hypothetical protein